VLEGRVDPFNCDIKEGNYVNGFHILWTACLHECHSSNGHNREDLSELKVYDVTEKGIAFNLVSQDGDTYIQLVPIVQRIKKAASFNKIIILAANAPSLPPYTWPSYASPGALIKLPDNLKQKALEIRDTISTAKLESLPERQMLVDFSID
jgi:hypothetical protein